MTDHGDLRSSLLPLSGAALLAALVAGWIWLPAVLQSFRPGAPDVVARSDFQLESVAARLWQDPFQAVWQHEKRFAPGRDAESVLPFRNSRAALSAAITQRLERAFVSPRKNVAQLTVLAVMVDGGPHAEQLEERRRQRYAVVSALGLKGFTPENGERLGYVQCHWSRDGSLLAEDRKAEISAAEITVPVPFEWFALDPREYRARYSVPLSVLVLWFDETLGGDPLERLDRLLVELVDQQRVANGSIDLKLLGPATSTALTAMLTAAATAQGARPSAAQNLDGAPETVSAQAAASLPESPTLQELDSWSRQLVKTIDNYLDGGLPVPDIGAKIQEKAHNVLVAKLARECSDDPVTCFLDAVTDLEVELDPIAKPISDSDPDWLRTTLGLWRNNILMEQWPDDPHASAALLLAFTSDRSRMRSTTEEQTIKGVAEQIRAAESQHPTSTAQLLDRAAPAVARLRRERPSAQPEATDRTTDLVRAWIETAPAAAADAPTPAPPRQSLRQLFTMYNTRATAPISDQIEHGWWQGRAAAASPVALGDPEHLATMVADLLGVREYNMGVADDLQLARALVRELINRGVRFVSMPEGSRPAPRDHLVLVGEWDTAYGRAMPRVFRQAVAEAIRNPIRQNLEGQGFDAELLEHASQTGAERVALEAVHSFRYLRGIDGQLPGEQAPAANPSAARTEELSERERIRLMEVPEGRSQLDYVRRLAEAIGRLQGTIHEHKGKLAAVGVVGSDVYDKQLILQALRRRLPAVSFFTTDLDARLLHPGQYTWSRNLIIASSFGLELDASIQRWIPPFRSSYQTSTFLGTLCAVGGATRADRTAVPPGVVASAVNEPRLYEVARSGAREITATETRLRPVHPDRGDQRIAQWFTALVVFVGLLLTIFSLSWLLSLARVLPFPLQADSGERRWLRRTQVVFVLLAALLSIALYRDGSAAGGEPVAMFEGISIWPTEVIRFLVFVACVSFLIHAAAQLRRSNDTIARDYLLTNSPNQDQSDQDQAEEDQAGTDQAPTTSGAASELRRAGSGIFDWLRRRFWLKDSGDDTEQVGHRQPVAAAQLWQGYVRKGRPKRRWTRAVLYSFGFVAAVGILMLMMGRPSVPIRGDLGLAVDRLALAFSVTALLLLTFYVLDAIRLCEGLVRRLADARITWPTQLLNRVQNEIGFDPEEACQFLKIDLIAERTRTVGRLVLYPFIGVFAMMVARSDIFDAWSWPMSLIIVFVLLFGFVLFCALTLRQVAEKARRSSLASLADQRSATLATEETVRDRRLRQIDAAIERIRIMDDGAFAHWFQHPLLRAMLLPFGGAGTMFLLDLLARLGV